LYLALALVVLWNVRRTSLAWLTAVVLLVLPVLVGTGRLYRGMHHPSDVAGSVLNATLCVALAWLVVQRSSRLPDHKATDRPTAAPAADRRGVAA
jgi:undecaprenyl-diphosphatase